MEATFVRDMPTIRTGATQKLWKLTEPYTVRGWGDEPDQTTEYVITSAVNALFSGPETYVFPANKQGEVIDFCEIDGSFRGDLDHDRAIEGLVDSTEGEQ